MTGFAPSPNPSPVRGRGELVWNTWNAFKKLKQQSAFSNDCSREAPLSRTAWEGPGEGA
jgi:hypothetical protein